MRYQPIAAMLMMASIAIAHPIQGPNPGEGSNDPERMSAANLIREECLRQAAAVAETWRKLGAPETFIKRAVKHHNDECHRAYAIAVNGAADRVLAQERAQVAQEKARRLEANPENENENENGTGTGTGTGTEPQRFATLHNVQGAVAGRLHAVKNAGVHLLRNSHLGPAMSAAVMQLAHHAPRLQKKMPTALEMERAGV
ncbi:MAG: hypothetical protein M1826_004755 [Phylliscum demangeonii]|nr:MAG: hypothetical protein M1826_004755 [Phylliscum demangeonii]